MTVTASLRNRPGDPGNSLARFRSILPLAAILVDYRWLLLPVAIVASLALSFALPAAGWSVMLGWILLPAIASDRPFHSLSIVGPATFAAGILFLKFGVGFAILNGLNVPMNSETITYCGGFAFLMIASLLLVMKVSGSWSQAAALIQGTLTKVEPELARVGLMLFGYTLLVDAVRVFTGAIDRANATIKTVGFGQMGWWSWFEIFSETTSIGIFLVPLVARKLPPGGGVICYGLVAIRSLAYLLGGSRSVALFSLAILALGFVTFSQRRSNYRELKIILIALMVWPSINFTSYLRNTKGFHDTKITDVRSRLGAAVAAAKTYQTEDLEAQSQSLLVSGRAIMEFSDPLIYDNTPAPHPFDGFSDLGNLAYVFIPKYFFPAKPILLDGNEIVISYTGLRQEGTSQTISLMADLYRRAGVSGVVAGSILSAIMLVFYLKISLFVMRRIDDLLGILMILLLITFGFRSPLFHWTVLSLGSFYLYSIPKYLVFFGFLVALSRVVGQRKSVLLPTQAFDPRMVTH